MSPDPHTLLLRHLGDRHWHGNAALSHVLGVDAATLEQLGQHLRDCGLPLRNDGLGWRLESELELLDATAIQSVIQAERRPVPVVEVFSELDSTNQYLLQHADPGPRACLAEYQTAGRGRRTRQWLSPYASGLCLSLGVAWPSAPPPGLSLALMLALARRMRAEGAHGVGVKWPNDLHWCERHKLAGLLVESRMNPDGSARLVLGLGLNIAPPADPAWAGLQQALPGAVSRNRWAGLALAEFLHLLAQLRQHGLAALLHDWDAFDVLRNRRIELLTETGSVAGVARGIEADGALRLEVDGELQRHVCGEVSVRQ